MKQLILVISLISNMFVAKAIDEKLVVEGSYQSKNLYVNNCMGENGVGFAVSKVVVNGKVTSDQVSSSAFEIDLSVLGLKEGEDVVIQIEYDGNCQPKVLNPGALQPIPTFDMQDIEIAQDGMIKWVTTGERGKLPYIVEQFKWNKWVKVGEVDGIGTEGENEYAYKAPLVSGVNKFRVLQKNLNGEQKIGKTISVTTDIQQPNFEYDKKNQKITFSQNTAYEVYDMYGQIRKRGSNTEIDFSNLEGGDYYLNFDNTMEKFRKK